MINFRIPFPLEKMQNFIIFNRKKHGYEFRGKIFLKLINIGSTFFFLKLKLDL